LKIGLSQRVLYHKGRAYDSIEHGWYRYLKEHTLIPVANRLDQDFQQLADELDAFIITGGDDSAIRRTTELRLANYILKQHKPMLGVCHGCFLLTDILGGQVEEIAGHMDLCHDISYNDRIRVVNSYHSLCISQLHKSGTVLATDSEGHCEAVKKILKDHMRKLLNIDIEGKDPITFHCYTKPTLLECSSELLKEIRQASKPIEPSKPTTKPSKPENKPENKLTVRQTKKSTARAKSIKNTREERSNSTKRSKRGGKQKIKSYRKKSRKKNISYKKR
jgi:anthranilate/para-aminobenzoate synthase component II